MDPRRGPARAAAAASGPGLGAGPPAGMGRMVARNWAIAGTASSDRDLE